MMETSKLIFFRKEVQVWVRSEMLSSGSEDGTISSTWSCSTGFWQAPGSRQPLTRGTKHPSLFHYLMRMSTAWRNARSTCRTSESFQGTIARERVTSSRSALPAGCEVRNANKSQPAASLIHTDTHNSCQRPFPRTSPCCANSVKS